MDETQKELLRSWLTKAANDLKSAFFVFKGITPEKTHDVRKLAVEASALESRFDQFIPIRSRLDALCVGVSLSR